MGNTVKNSEMGRTGGFYRSDERYIYTCTHFIRRNTKGKGHSGDLDVDEYYSYESPRNILEE